MNIKIKNLIFAVSSFVLLFPVIAFGQWDVDYAFERTEDVTLPYGHITDIVVGVMNWLLGIVGVIGIIGFVIAGILYLTAAGNDDQIGTAKKAMMWSIVGVIVALMGYVMIQAIDLMLNADSGF